MKKVCAWCLKDMGYIKGGKKGDITHGICKSCAKKFKEERIWEEK